MKTIIVLMDTLNRRMLNVYNEQAWVHTPNIDRLAARSIVFDNHWAGSLPCMPARRDLMTGRIGFLEKGWGGIEPFDVTLPQVLREGGIYSHMVTDHYHYFNTGGENYCQSFSSWDLHRGQEGDAYVSRVAPPELPAQSLGVVRPQYELNRSRFVMESDYPGPRTFAAACEWLEANREASDFLLMVEAFDPHEPFDCPQEYLDLYHDSYTGPRYDWPKYGPVDVPAEAQEHIIKRYAGTLTMIDRAFGRLLDTLDKHQLWEDTLLLFTTDHGFLLGEHNLMAKNVMQVYNELAHLPLIVHLPGGAGAGRRVAALTQNVDLMPTILDYKGLESSSKVHGHSLRGLLEGTEESVREAALYGYHGMNVNMTDGAHTYFRASIRSDNTPCSTYTAMPTSFRRYLGVHTAGSVETGRFLKWTDYPVFRIPSTAVGKPDKRLGSVKDTLLFDIRSDYAQEHPIGDEALQEQYAKRLGELMREHDAPDEQFIRLGL